MVLNGLEVLTKAFKNLQNLKNYDEDSDKAYILEVDVEYPEDLHDLYSGLPFFQKELKLINAIKLYLTCMIKKLCNSDNSFDRSIKSQANTKKVRRKNSV